MPVVLVDREVSAEIEFTAFGLDGVYATVDELPSVLANHAPENVFVGGFGSGGAAALELAATSGLRFGGFFGLFADSQVPRVDVTTTARPRLAVCARAGSATDLIAAFRRAGASVDVFDVADDDDAVSSQVRIISEWLRPRLPTTQPLQWTLEPAVTKGETNVIFDVPMGTETVLARFPITCRGASFALVPRAPGRVAVTFYSPAPNATADAIAARIRNRLVDANPDDAAACPVS